MKKTVAAYSQSFHTISALRKNNIKINQKHKII